MTTKTNFVVSLVLLLVGVPIFSQVRKPAFEVATVKPAIDEALPLIQVQQGGRFVSRNVPLKQLITFAYRIRSFQLSGGPNWIADDKWRIEAKAEEPSSGTFDPAVPEAIAPMLQSLLEDRFKLKMHTESKVLPVYSLVVARDGLKMKISQHVTGEAEERERLGKLPWGRLRAGRGEMEGVGIRISSLVQLLAQQVGRQVIDNTSLNDVYDIQFRWAYQPTNRISNFPETPEDDSSIPDGPSIFSALQEQLAEVRHGIGDVFSQGRSSEVIGCQRRQSQKRM